MINLEPPKERERFPSMSYALKEKELCAAVKEENREKVLTLLDEPPLSKHKLFFQAIALKEAAKCGYTPLVNELLTSELIAQHLFLVSEAFMGAISRGHVAVMERVLQVEAFRAHIAHWGGRALCDSVGNGHLEIMNRLLLMPGVSAYFSDLWRQKALCDAARNGHLEAIDRLLQMPEMSARLSDWGGRVLCAAAEHGHLEVVDSLLERKEIGSRVGNLNGDNLLSRYLEVGKEIVRDTLAYLGGAVAQSGGIEALCKAVMGGHIDVVRRLLQIPRIQIQMRTWGEEVLCGASVPDKTVSYLIYIDGNSLK